LQPAQSVSKGRANIAPRAQYRVSLRLHEADLVADSHQSRCGASWTHPASPAQADRCQAVADAVTSGGTDERSLLLDARRTMFEIRSSSAGFVVFDTTEQEPIMRFDSKDEATELVAELVIAESCAQLQAWKPPTARR